MFDNLAVALLAWLAAAFVAALATYQYTEKAMDLHDDNDLDDAGLTVPQGLWFPTGDDDDDDTESNG